VGAAARRRSEQEELRTIRKATVCALNHMLDLKDLNTGVHGTRLAEWAVRIGQEMGIDDGCLEDIETAALLHDAGQGGRARRDPAQDGPARGQGVGRDEDASEYSWAVLRLVPGLERASLFALHHHEKYDGSGYPAGLKGDEIPIGPASSA
jgi:putative two-component system response regulator